MIFCSLSSHCIILQEFAGTVKDVKVVLAGLSNVYVDYITTFEEYQIQRYEGASTIYGPHSLNAYIDIFTKLAQAMVKVRSKYA